MKNDEEYDAWINKCMERWQMTYWAKLLSFQRPSFLLFCLTSSAFLVACGNAVDEIPDSQWKPLEIFSSCNKVAIGEFHALVINDKGDLYAWGRNAEGELGDKTTIPQSGRQVNASRPKKINTIDNVKCVAVGMNYSVAVKHDGSVWQWGIDYDPQHKPPFLSDTNFPGPTRVDGINDAVGIAAGGGFALALNSLGEVYSWGRNDVGQLGHGKISPYEQPGMVQSSEKFHFIEAGLSGSYAIDEHKDMWVWGSNAAQTLGIKNEMERRTAPIKNSYIKDVVKVSVVDSSYITALKADGRVITWGFNLNDDLGTGDANSQTLLPTAIHYKGRAIDISDRSLLSLNGDIWRWGIRYFNQAELRWTWFWSQSVPTKYFQDTGAKNIFGADVGVLVNEKGCLESWGYSAYGLRGDGSTDRQKIFFNKERVALTAENHQLLCIQQGDKK